MLSNLNPDELRMHAIIREYMNGTLSSTEIKELEQWIDADPGNRRFFINTSSIYSSGKISPDYVVKKTRGSFFAFYLVEGVLVTIVLLIAWYMMGRPVAPSPYAAVSVDTISKPYSAPGVTIEKDSVMKFKRATVKDIMGAISYCYKVPVVYKGKIPGDTYSASISRTMNLKEMVGLLKLVGIKASFDGKRIVVEE